VSEGRGVRVAVDGRADVFALGVLLYEALAGALPPPREPVRTLRRRNSQVTAGLADLLGRCLAPDPGDRYAEAGDLAADLRRYLADLPLREVANRSVLERWCKWRRRRPTGLALLCLLLVGLTSGGLARAHFNRQAEKAHAALDEGRERLRRDEYEEASGAFKRGLALAEDFPFGRTLAGELRGQLRHAEQGRAARDLHSFTDRMRALYDADGLSPEEAREVEAHCRVFWERRDLIAGRLAPGATPGRADQVRADLLDLAILWTNLRVRRAGGPEVDGARGEALGVLAQAESLFGPSCVLYRERLAHAEALGRADEAREAARQSAALAPRTAWEHYALGRLLLRAGNLPEAAAHFDTARDLEPQSLWPHFYQGKCAFRRGRYEDAVVAFTTCVALSEGRAWCYYNRGLAYDRLDRPERALQDYDRALRLDPALAEAALNRGMLHYRLTHYPAALADLERALDSGADPAVVHYDKALVQLAHGDKAAAQLSLDQALRHDPGHQEAHTLRNSVRPQR
jgi:tetratricopeptide (TPR) repeat protein